MRLTILAMSFVLFGTSAAPDQQLVDYFAHAEQAETFFKQREYTKAIAEFTEAIRLAPDDSSRANRLNDRALVWRLMGQFDKAITDDEAALQIAEFPAARKSLGITSLEKGDYDKAIANFNLALRPDAEQAHKSGGHDNDWNARVFSYRAVALSKKGEYDKAIDDFNIALRLGPRELEVYQQAAWFRATCPVDRYRNGARAVANARKACELSNWQFPQAIDTLAAACAETCDFEAAIKWQRQTIDKPARPFGSQDAAEKRLKLYQAGSPFRDEPVKK